MKIAFLFLVTVFSAVSASAQPGSANPALTGARTFNVRTFGATGDGRTLDTDAINRAILAADATGGGTVKATAPGLAPVEIVLHRSN